MDGNFKADVIRRVRAGLRIAFSNQKCYTLEIVLIKNMFSKINDYLHGSMHHIMAHYGNAEVSGLKGPGFNPRSRQEKEKYIFYCFDWLL